MIIASHKWCFYGKQRYNEVWLTFTVCASKVNRRKERRSSWGTACHHRVNHAIKQVANTTVTGWVTTCNGVNFTYNYLSYSAKAKMSSFHVITLKCFVVFLRFHAGQDSQICTSSFTFKRLWWSQNLSSTVTKLH